ncbi:MAG: anthranilate synthase component I family protein [bacterium]
MFTLSSQKLVPVIKFFPMENFSPVNVFQNFANDKFSFLLESARYHPITGRYSFIGFNPFLIFKSKKNNIEIIYQNKKQKFSAHPIETLKKIMKSFKIEKKNNLPIFTGGAVGYFSYDLVHFFEKVPCKSIDDLDLPECYLLFVKEVIVFDHLKNKIFIVVNAKEEEKKQAKERIKEIEEKYFKNNVPFCDEIISKQKIGKIKSNFTKKNFEKIVKIAKEYIKAGDIFQVNLSQRFNVDIEIHPFIIYKLLREINPSPFASYFNFDDLKIVSCSPERLLHKKNKIVQTRPIAGTRPKGKNNELLLDPKEKAEHIMLVDLERSDLGRICEYGTVVADEIMGIEDYSHVSHIVSNVKGVLKNNIDVFDCLKACFPGGTITGTPKIRSMEIIEELEPIKRGIYTGSIGFIDFSGDFDINIVIRTFIIKNNKAYIQVGAGIVADSIPEREYFETLYKAQALIETLNKLKNKK